ncbi:coenzyme F420-0:L-glutamate ligase [Mesorhizobium sp. GR13]|uniref:coenzyme F420-0:L-glutamate ligase n=1 Tax=Mesorhizobium sp. GR13 TaxID=2562308 RepID=UPI0010BF9F44|nr:coenzyme F420-0:L-glutamate ligase [Mesorhizobium sp. GR13]
MLGGQEVQLIAVPGLPMIAAGDDLGQIALDGLERMQITLRDGDVLVFAQKIVSKAEDRAIYLAKVAPSDEAKRIAADVRKDPRLVELVLSQSNRIVRQAPDVLIVEHKLGFVMANAGIDMSNVESGEFGARALLLPENPDRSAEALCSSIRKATGAAVAVVINDSFGRPWRQGVTGVALGAFGIPSLRDRRGKTDLYGRRLEVTVVAFADEIAAAASLVMGQGAEGLPLILVRGLSWDDADTPASSICRPASQDLFR